MSTRLRHFWLVLTRLPGILFNREKRALFTAAGAFLRALPEKFTKPLPELMAELSPLPAGMGKSSPELLGLRSELLTAIPPASLEKSLREIADIAAVLNHRSPLGLCLRRSLTRYYFLRRAGLPVEVKFGARFKDGKPDRQVTGHAWLTLHGQPYYEADENWREFTVMLTYPESAA